MHLILKKKFIDKVFLIILILISVLFYWFIFDISGRIHPEVGERLSNLYKYNSYYYSYVIVILNYSYYHGVIANVG